VVTMVASEVGFAEAACEPFGETMACASPRAAGVPDGVGRPWRAAPVALRATRLRARPSGGAIDGTRACSDARREGEEAS
jgi:hypothetical protein